MPLKAAAKCILIVVPVPVGLPKRYARAVITMSVDGLRGFVVEEGILRPLAKVLLVGTLEAREITDGEISQALAPRNTFAIAKTVAGLVQLPEH